MKIKEILELTKTKTIAEIAKEDVRVDESIVRKAMQRAGCYTIIGQPGWFFEENESVEVLERSIYDLIAQLAAIREEEQRQYISSFTENVSKDPIERERATFDIDVQLTNKMRCYCIKENKTTYEVVEEAISDYLEKEGVE